MEMWGVQLNAMVSSATHKENRRSCFIIFEEKTTYFYYVSL